MCWAYHEIKETNFPNHLLFGNITVTSLAISMQLLGFLLLTPGMLQLIYDVIQPILLPQYIHLMNFAEI